MLKVSSFDSHFFKREIKTLFVEYTFIVFYQIKVSELKDCFLIKQLEPACNLQKNKNFQQSF